LSGPAITLSDEVMRALAHELLNATPIRTELPGFEAFTLCAALQLAWRHPALTDLQRAIVEKATRDLQEAIGQRSLLARELLVHGWNTALDVEAKP